MVSPWSQADQITAWREYELSSVSVRASTKSRRKLGKLAYRQSVRLCDSIPLRFLSLHVECTHIILLAVRGNVVQKILLLPCTNDVTIQTRCFYRARMTKNSPNAFLTSCHSITSLKYNHQSSAFSLIAIVFHVYVMINYSTKSKSKSRFSRVEEGGCSDQDCYMKNAFSECRHNAF